MQTNGCTSGPRVRLSRHVSVVIIANGSRFLFRSVLKNLDLLKRDKTAAYHDVESRQKRIDLFLQSTISMTIGKSSDNRKILAVWIRLEWP